MFVMIAVRTTSVHKGKLNTSLGRITGLGWIGGLTRPVNADQVALLKSTWASITLDKSIKAEQGLQCHSSTRLNAAHVHSNRPIR